MKNQRRKFVKNASLHTLGAFVLNSLKNPQLLAQKASIKNDHDLKNTLVNHAKRSNEHELTLLYPKGSLPNLLPVVREFKKDTGVSISLKEGNLQDLPSQMIFEHRVPGKSIWDIALPPTFSIPNLANAGVLVKLDEYLESKIINHLEQKALYTLGDRYNNSTYGFQADGDVYLMFYNFDLINKINGRDKFEQQFGKKFQQPKTWFELDRMIQFFHNPTKGVFGGSLYRIKGFLRWEFWLRLHGKGMRPFDDNFKSNLNTEEAHSALDELTSITEYLKPDVLKNGLFENFASFAAGDSFCNIGWGGTQKFLMSQKRDYLRNLTYAIPPGGTGKDGKSYPISLFNWGWNYCVNSKSPKRFLAATFAAYASTDSNTIKSVREPDGYFDPHRLEHYQDSEIKAIYGQDFLKVHSQAMQIAIPDLYISENHLFFASLESALLAVIKKELKPKTALKLLHQKWEKLTQKNISKKDWKNLQKSYLHSGFKHFM